eukprot:TRINITY_DN5850_c0_g1_i1.p1 TRINITY_DN5850_c0_g1~~TRINITY_DN5850_c0_g1_i1.p1  ORF type:complete len:812 (+),score=125.16 TRINITY_DN5850_c0_g1_i1:97-2532(+)
MAPQESWSFDDITEDTSDGLEVGSLIEKIQTQVYHRRIRVKDAFADFDKFRSGRVTKSNFARALNQLLPSVLSAEADTLAEHFTENGPQVRWPMVVNYTKFCQIIDEVFGPASLDATPAAKVPLPGWGLSCAGGHFKATTRPADEHRIGHILNRIAMLSKTRGIEWTTCLRTKAHTECPRFSGKVSPAVFCRRFPFTTSFSEEDMQILQRRYTDKDGVFHLHALEFDVQNIMEEAEQREGEWQSEWIHPGIARDEEDEYFQQSFAQQSATPTAASLSVSEDGEVPVPWQRPKSAHSRLGSALQQSFSQSQQAATPTAASLSVSEDGEVPAPPQRPKSAHSRLGSMGQIRTAPAEKHDWSRPGINRNDNNTEHLQQSFSGAQRIITPTSHSISASEQEETPAPRQRPKSANPRLGSTGQCCTGKAEWIIPDVSHDEDNEYTQQSLHEATAEAAIDQLAPEEPEICVPRQRPKSAHSSLGATGQQSRTVLAEKAMPQQPQRTMSACGSRSNFTTGEHENESMAQQRPKSAVTNSRRPSHQSNHSTRMNRPRPSTAPMIHSASSPSHPGLAVVGFKTTAKPTSQDVMAKLQAIVAKRRLRLHDRFIDFDQLRKGVVTPGQMRTVLGIMRIDLRAAEYQVLEEAYKDPGPPDSMNREPFFRYRDFCADVAFKQDGQEQSFKSTSGCALKKMIMSIRAKAKCRRLELYTAFDDRCNGKPARRVNRSVLLRIMHLLGFPLTEPEVDMLWEAFSDQHGFDYLKFCTDVDPFMASDAALWHAKCKKLQPPTTRYFEQSGLVCSHHARLTRSASAPRARR